MQDGAINIFQHILYLILSSINNWGGGQNSGHELNIHTQPSHSTFLDI